MIVHINMNENINLTARGCPPTPPASGFAPEARAPPTWRRERQGAATTRNARRRDAMGLSHGDDAAKGTDASGGAAKRTNAEDRRV